MPTLHPPTGSSQLSSVASSVCPHGPHCLWCWFHGVLGPHTLACCLPLRANSRGLMWFRSLWLELEAPRTLLSVPMEHTFPAPSPLTLLVLHCSRCVVPGRPRKVGSGAGPLHLQQVCFIASLQVHRGEASALCYLLRNVNWRGKKKSPCVFSTSCHLSAGAYIFELAKLISELHCADPLKLVF